MLILFTFAFTWMFVFDASVISGSSRLAARISRKVTLTYSEIATRLFIVSEPRVPVLDSVETNWKSDMKMRLFELS